MYETRLKHYTELLRIAGGTGLPRVRGAETGQTDSGRCRLIGASAALRCGGEQVHHCNICVHRTVCCVWV